MGGLTSKANEKLSEETVKHIKAFKKATRANAYSLEDLSTGIVKQVPRLERTEKSSILKRRQKVNFFDPSCLQLLFVFLTSLQQTRKL